MLELALTWSSRLIILEKKTEDGAGIVSRKNELNERSNKAGVVSTPHIVYMN
jgi:hypothetical protein